jgi:hypothetical protein
MKWLNENNQFPSLMVLRRYLKLIILFCIKNNLMDKDIDKIRNDNYPFDIASVPVKYPSPKELKL